MTGFEVSTSSLNELKALASMSMRHRLQFEQGEVVVELVKVGPYLLAVGDELRELVGIQTASLVIAYSTQQNREYAS